jgi:eukaryotic-like serine/threonine-protein kinase
MTPELWKKINRIYHEALELKADQRTAFLKSACADDEKLLRQVCLLIGFHEREGGFLESPAVAIAAKVAAADNPKRHDEASARILITIAKGPREGKTLVFSGHKTCVFGRANDCYEVLPEKDLTVGRHHIMLEVNAPDISITDLGSVNGTLVNGRKLGGGRDADPTIGSHKPKSQSTQLHHGDHIQIGDTLLEVKIEAPMVCPICKQRTHVCSPAGGMSRESVLCEECSVLIRNTVCREALIKPVASPKTFCDLCKKVINDEGILPRQRNYLCESCRARIADDKKALKKLLDTTAHSWKSKGSPSIKGFELSKTLGSGSMGTSYLAKDKNNKQKVVVKVVFSKVIPDTLLQSDLLSRFDEIRNLRHANITEILDFGSASNAFYVVSNYCDKGNVGDLMARRNGKIGVDEAIPIMRQVLEGLAFAHKKGFFHGNLKPENILLSGSEGSVMARLSDFGLSYNLQQAGIGKTTLPEDSRIFPFTPNELLTGLDSPGPISDVWSIAAVFYFMLTSKFPHGSQREAGSIGELIESKIVPINKWGSGLMPELSQMIDVSLGSRENRYRHAGEMLDVIKQIQNKIVRLTLVT